MMQRRSRGNLGFRILVVGVFSLSLIGHSERLVSAQAPPLAAAIISGDCGDPGAVAADLRPLAVNEGGALTSFTTIDLSTEEVTSGGYAIIAGDLDTPAMCGAITGSGDDVYVAVRERNDSGLGGVAWLHARGEQTRVTLFAGEGLGEGPTDEPTEEPNAPPEPPVDETPEPTSEPGANLTLYESPTYGYTVAYDAAEWQVTSELTQPDEGGPFDYFVLGNEVGSVQAEFIGLAQLNPPMTATEYINRFIVGTQSNATYSGVSVRTDAAGEPIRGGDEANAFAAINFTFLNDEGRAFDNVYFVEAWQVPATKGFLIMIFQTSQRSYEQWIPAREALEQGVTIPV